MSSLFRAISILCLFASLVALSVSLEVNRTFTLGHRCFLKDGVPFRYISGTMHYWRIPHEYWEDSFIKMRMAGLLVVDTYLIWTLHEQESGDYRFDGNLNITRYFQLAQKHDLLVILRAGPFIASETENGGLPYWLMSENPNMMLRTSDPSYLKFVARWYEQVFPVVKPYLYQNGGPIITVQVENEYGAYGCDPVYMDSLRDIFRKHLGDEIILLTNNDALDPYLKCGRCNGTLSTGDFGTPSISGYNVTYYVDNLSRWACDGPLVDSEFYPGWLDVWGSPYATVTIKELLDNAKILMDRNVNFNLYIFRGGTNFGFVSGGSSDPYQSVTTTYEYDAPLSEAGDPNEKYYAIREFIGQYFPLPPGPVPKPSPKGAYGKVRLQFSGTIFDNLDDLCPRGPTTSQLPLSFEVLRQIHGFVLYRNVILQQFSDPTILEIPGLRDRAYIFVDKVPAGILSRGAVDVLSMDITVFPGQVLDILVQNQGRGTFYPASDFKGIIGNVTLGNKVLTKWTMFPLTLPEYPSRDPKPFRFPWLKNIVDPEVPAIYSGSFFVDKPLDTYINTDGWRNGYIFVNGHNLGRYWPVMGPQITLYVPAVYLFENKENTVEVLELEKAPCHRAKLCTMELVAQSILNGTVPQSTYGTLPKKYDSVWRRYQGKKYMV